MNSLFQEALFEAKLSPMRHTAKVGAALKLLGVDATIARFNNSYKGGGILEIKDAAGNWVSHPSVLHAEEACIVQAARLGQSTDGATLAVTHSPCFRCARLIVAAGISEVYYEHKWWDKEAITHLLDWGVVVKRLRKKRTTA